MKKIAFVSLILAIIMIFAGCAPAAPIASGTYIAQISDENEYICPYFDINTYEMTFSHGASLMYSYAMSGKIEISGSTLTAIPDDGNGKMVFIMHLNDRLIYIAEESTITPLTAIDVPPIRDGTMFKLIPSGGIS